MKTWILPWLLLINESCERARCPKGLAQPRLLRHFPLKSLNSIACDAMHRFFSSKSDGEVDGRAWRFQISSRVKNPHLSHLFCPVKIDLWIRIYRQFFSLWVICVFSDIVWQCPVCHMWLSITPYICSNFHFWKQKIQAIRSLFPIGVILFLVPL